ncbi:hypothetical protein LINGRAHAP2_LOCUS3830 [Linum grandiflorum]
MRKKRTTNGCWKRWQRQWVGRNLRRSSLMGIWPCSTQSKRYSLKLLTVDVNGISEKILNPSTLKKR